jgi:riboflavin biosynthesis pyrimidine reductase
LQGRHALCDAAIVQVQRVRIDDGNLMASTPKRRREIAYAKGILDRRARWNGAEVARPRQHHSGTRLHDI